MIAKSEKKTQTKELRNNESKHYRDPHHQAAYSICESSFLIHQDIYHDLFVLDDSLTSYRFSTRTEELI